MYVPAAGSAPVPGKCRPVVCNEHASRFLDICTHARRDKYRVLEKFEVQVPDEQLDALDALEPGWARFQAGLDDAAARLDRSKESFRERVKGMLDAFLRDIATMYEEFVKGAPYGPEAVGVGGSAAAAMRMVAAGKRQAAAARAKVGWGAWQVVVVMCSGVQDMCAVLQNLHVQQS